MVYICDPQKGGPVAYLIQILNISAAQREGLDHVNGKILAGPSIDTFADLGDHLCSGAIRLDPSTRKLRGKVFHKKEESELYDITIPRRRGEPLTFTRREHGCAEEIRYLLHENERGNSWEGTFEGKLVGKGFARCMLVEIDDHFFDHRSTTPSIHQATPFRGVVQVSGDHSPLAL